MPDIILTQLEELLHDQDKNVRANAVSALGNIKNQIPGTILTHLEKLLNDQEYSVSYYAANTLKKIYERGGIEAAKVE